MKSPGIAPRLKTALELGPLLAFFLGYVWLRGDTYMVLGREYDGFIVVTALFIPVLAASTLALWRLSGKVSRIQITTMILVVFFGALTVWLNDERFFKMKSTFVFGGFAAVLWLGLWRGQSYFAYVMEGMMPLRHEGWMILTRRLAWFFLLMAAANELIWRSFSTDVYVVWDTFGQAGAMFGFFIAQSRLIEAHWIEEPDAG